MYAHLPPEPQRKEPQIDLFTDSQDGDDTKPGIASYLDEFLSAIKIFGYLERPVFHELTRHMQTRKLIAGETFLLEEEKGFCVVVDGLVQVFVKSNQANTNSFSSLSDDDEETPSGGQGYQLLTEVKNGAPMSSLFTILSLFTEDVQLRQEDDEDVSASATPPSEFFMNGIQKRATIDMSQINAGYAQIVSLPSSPPGAGFPFPNGTLNQRYAS